MTELKAKEEALRVSEERYALAVRGSTDGIWDWNVSTDDIHYSPRFVELLGYEEHEFPSRVESFETRLHPHDRVPTLAAVRQGTRVALANKECLVSAGDVFTDEVARYKTELLPVDSEHSAAFQALTGAAASAIEKITLTASGGPFRTWSAEQLKAATPEQALKHPNWSMGAKVTIDSATLMNKGLELIEAFHLFPVGVEALDCLVHPQSIVHCLVSYSDGSVLAQLAPPDMRTPIAVALAWPGRMVAPTEKLDLAALGTLTFEAADETRFPALSIAKAAMKRGLTAPAVLNAANEVAVKAFLDRRIGFTGIPQVVSDTLEKAEKSGLVRSASTVEDILAVDAAARRLAEESVHRYL